MSEPAYDSHVRNKTNESGHPVDGLTRARRTAKPRVTATNRLVTPSMPYYALVTTDTTDGPRWEIHRAGCSHSCLHNRNNWNVNEIQATSPQDLVTRELSLNDNELRHSGWSEVDFRIMPCAKGTA